MNLHSLRVGPASCWGMIPSAFGKLRQVDGVKSINLKSLKQGYLVLFGSPYEPQTALEKKDVTQKKIQHFFVGVFVVFCFPSSHL